MSEASRTMKNSGQDGNAGQSGSGSQMGQGGQAGKGNQSGNSGHGPAAALESAKSTFQQVGETAREAASHVADEGRHAASYLGSMAEDATASVAGGLKSAAQSLRQHSPNDGVLGQASTAVARTLEGTGRYLEQDGLSGMGADLTRMIKNNPLPSLFVGVGIGYLIAQATTPRR